MLNELLLTNKARQAIAAACSVDEVKDIRDKAEAIRLYAKQAGMGLEMVNDAAEIKLRAERKAGELLADMAERGERQTRGGNRKSNLQGESLVPSLPDLGVTDIQSHRWQQMADVPEELFEQYIDTKDDGKELSTAGVMRIWAQQNKPDPADTPDLPSGKFRCIVIDPPWPVEKIVRAERPNQSQSLDYPTMTMEEIGALPIPEIAEQSGCLVFLWVTHKFLPDGLDLFEKWGVNYQCVMTWNKPSGMTPYSWMYNTEHVLFGRIGNLQLEQLGLKLSFDAPVVGHSVKPDAFYERVLAVSREPRLEMFARRPRSGFIVWGNEVVPA